MSNNSKKSFSSNALAVTPIVWRSADGTEYKLHQMRTAHIINIMRQLLNKLAERLELDLVPIHTPVASINFYKISWSDAIKYINFFGQEVNGRLSRGEELEPGYSAIWKSLNELSINISNKVNSKPKLIDDIVKNENPIWDKNNYKKSIPKNTGNYNYRYESDYDDDYYEQGGFF